MRSSPDVVVIGAGIIGCAVAAECARRGTSVEVVDVRAVGQGATQASAGLLAPFIEAPETSPLGALGARSLAAYDDFVQRAVEESGVRVEYAREGILEVASDEATWAALQAVAARHTAAGVACDLLDAAGVRAIEPELADDLVGGLLVSAHGFVAAQALTQALADAARRRGASFVLARGVQRIAGLAGGVRVEFDGGARTAGTAVLAAGAWSSQIDLAGGPPLPVRPVRGQLVTLGWCGPPPRRPVWGPDCYLVPWRDGTLLVGATVEEVGFDERATVAGVFDLLEAACALAPRAWQASFRGVRVGLRPATPDDLPIVGPSRRVPGLVYATGHYRNGVLLAPVTAELVAALVLEGRRDPALEALSPARFGDL